MRVEEMRQDYILQSEEEVFALARRYFGLDTLHTRGRLGGARPRQSAIPSASPTDWETDIRGYPPFCPCHQTFVRYYREELKR